MARISEIVKQGLEKKVIELSINKSSREIADILEKEDGFKISYAAVANFIKEIRQERQEATKASIAETVTPGLNKDLEFFDEMLDTYRELFRALSGRHPEKAIGLGGEKLADSVKVEPKGLAEIGKEYRATVELKVKIAGGTGEDEISALGQLVNSLRHNDLRNKQDES